MESGDDDDDDDEDIDYDDDDNMDGDNMEDNVWVVMMKMIIDG